MCRTCKAENPKWSRGVRVPVKDLPMFFASQPSWNFEQKIYGHNVVVTERARPTLTGQLGCHDLDGVVHRRQDHFLVREIFHCPGKKYNCSPRLACTGRRRHCYGLCKVTVYSANKDVAIVQFAGTHGSGALQRRVWPYNQYESIPDSPPRDMSKKESKMRAIFGSPTKDEINWNKTRNKDHDATSFKIPKHQSFPLEETIDFNTLTNFGTHLVDSVQSVYNHVTQPQVQLAGYPSTILYPSPPGYGDQMLSPDMSTEDQLKQHSHMMQTACSQLSPYAFYHTQQQTAAVHPTNPQSPQNFWNTTGMMLTQHMPVTPPQIKSEKYENNYIPTLSEMNTKVEDIDTSFFDMTQMEPYQKRRRLDQGMPLSHPEPQDSLITASSADIWRPYLHPTADQYAPDPMIQQVKLENPLIADSMLQQQYQQEHDQQQHDQQQLHHQQQQLQQQQLQQQENLISFMLKNEDQKLLANMSNGLQLTKL